MAITFTDADRAAGLACAAVVKERGSLEGVDLAALFTDRISDAMRPERERTARLESALRGMIGACDPHVASARAAMERP